MLGVNPPPPLQLHASQAVHQSPQQGAPPLQFLYIKCVISEKTSMTAFHIDSKRFIFFPQKKEENNQGNGSNVVDQAKKTKLAN